MANKTFAIENTLFCQFENNELKIILEDWAAQNRINIYYGKPSSPDIIAVPFFAAVVDKRVVGSEIWENILSIAKRRTNQSQRFFLMIIRVRLFLI